MVFVSRNEFYDGGVSIMHIKNIILLFMLITQITVFSQPMNLVIKLDKKEYLIYEPIQLLIEITNESNQPVNFVFDHFCSAFKLTVTHNGKIIKCSSSGAAMIGTMVIGSKEEYIDYFEFLTVFGCTNSKGGIEYNLQHLSKGSYTVELEYNFGKKVLNNGYDLIVKSNKLEFFITEPQERVYKRQIEKYISLMKNPQKYDSETFEKIIDEIIEIDSLSPYSLLAQFRLITRFKALGEKLKRQNRMEKACKSFPNSFVSLSYAMYDKKILDKMANSKEFNGKVIQEYSKKVKDSRAKIKHIKQNDIKPTM